jgi:hypothetical protein
LTQTHKFCIPKHFVEHLTSESTSIELIGVSKVVNIEWVPIVMFIGITVVLCTIAWLRYKAKEGMQQTFRAALDKGQDLTPEIIDRLGHPKAPKDKDMRYGIIWLSLAVALVLIGFAIPEPEAFRGILAGAAFPFSIGAAYLILHKFADKD